MHGIPFHLNTRADYERVYVKALDGVHPVEQVIPRLQGLLNTRMAYEFDRDLGADEAATGPEPDYRVIESESEDGTPVRTQLRLVDQPGARLYRLGFSVEEVEGMVSELEDLK